jgi:hypothetical protein
MPLSFSACCTAFTCSALPPRAMRPLPDLPADFISEPDFMSELDFMSVLDFVSVLDFMSVLEEPAPVPEPEALEPLDVEGLADGVDVAPEPALFFMSLSVPLVAPGALPVPAPDVLLAAPLLAPEPLAPPAPEPLPPCAKAVAATMTPATVSASALVQIFIEVLLQECESSSRTRVVPGQGMEQPRCHAPVTPAHQPACRRSATGFRISCSAVGGASARAMRGSVTGRPSRAER